MLSFSPKSVGIGNKNENEISYIDVNTQELKVYYQNKYVSTNISDILYTEGRGSYIFIACWGLSSISIPDISVLR